MLNSIIVLYICSPIMNADMVELVDTLDLGSSAARRGFDSLYPHHYLFYLK